MLFKKTSSVVWLVVMLSGSTGQAGPVTITYDIKAYIDGRDRLVIDGQTMQWHHLENLPVGLWGSPDKPTYIWSSINGTNVLDAYEWWPTWPDGTGAGVYSSAFSGLSPVLPDQDMVVVLTEVFGRADASVFQYPAEDNGYAAIVEFYDSPSGAEWYQMHLAATYEEPPATPRVPAPAPFVLGSLGASFVIWLRNRRAF